MNEWIKKIKLRLPAIFLLVVSVLFWAFYDRYETVGPALLDAPSLADATRLRGDCSETNGLFVLTVAEGGKTASINFRLPHAIDYELIRVSGRIKVEGVVPGKYPWNCARLLLIQYDKINKWIPTLHSMSAQSGTLDWEEVETIFELMPETVHADVVIQQTGLAGAAEFDQLVAVPVRYRTSFVWWRIFFSGLWGIAGLLYFRRCRLDRRKLRLLILLNALAILVGTLMPGVWIEDVSKKVKQGIARSVDQSPKPQVVPSKKPPVEAPREQHRIDQFNEMVGNVHQVGHFLLFASLCFLVYLSAALERQHPIYFFKVAFDLMLFAIITESLQYLTLDRTPGITDWLKDVYGMAAAFLLFLVLLVLGKLFCFLKRAK